MKVLDRQAMSAQARQAGLNVTDRILDIYEDQFPIVLLAYQAGKDGKEFDILPYKEEN